MDFFDERISVVEIFGVESVVFKKDIGFLDGYVDEFLDVNKTHAFKIVGKQCHVNVGIRPLFTSSVGAKKNDLRKVYALFFDIIGKLLYRFENQRLFSSHNFMGVISAKKSEVNDLVALVNKLNL